MSRFFDQSTAVERISFAADDGPPDLFGPNHDGDWRC